MVAERVSNHLTKRIIPPALQAAIMLRTVITAFNREMWYPQYLFSVLYYGDNNLNSACQFKINNFLPSYY